ncbi:MAG: manganese catalase family protein [Bacilli bacterium]|nr:manganese catalase family protein [Bacilli bacterium]
MDDSNIYQSNLPYPDIKVCGKNKYYATLLKDDYTGLVSEMTAINQYIYHAFDIEMYDQNLHKMLKNIAIVEMYHLDILAQLIILLGEEPVYFAQNSFWNGSYVDYGHNVLEQLQSDLKAEYKAIENYKRHIEMIKDTNIQNILKRIILDEEIHVKLFTMAINKLIIG